MRTAALIVGVALLLVCLYWTFDYVRRRTRG
jgi:hypothetical protein